MIYLKAVKRFPKKNPLQLCYWCTAINPLIPRLVISMCLNIWHQMCVFVSTITIDPLQSKACGANLILLYRESVWLKNSSCSHAYEIRNLAGNSAREGRGRAWRGHRGLRAYSREKWRTAVYCAYSTHILINTACIARNRSFSAWIICMTSNTGWAPLFAYINDYAIVK